LCISFTNQGEVPGEIKSKLFNKFGTSKKTGTGLGLYGAKLIIEAHGGTIDYEPLEGGTRFIVRIPFA
jgi:signal transduction histidine kinase